jgi:hypothetical protein
MNIGQRCRPLQLDVLPALRRCVITRRLVSQEEEFLLKYSGRGIGYNALEARLSKVAKGLEGSYRDEWQSKTREWANFLRKGGYLIALSVEMVKFDPDRAQAALKGVATTSIGSTTSSATKATNKATMAKPINAFLAMSFSAQNPPVLLKPGFRLSIVRARRLDPPPKPRRMIQLSQMHQFMENNVVRDQFRRLNQSPVKRDRPAYRAGTPARALIANRHAAHG